MDTILRAEVFPQKQELALCELDSKLPLEKLEPMLTAALEAATHLHGILRQQLVPAEESTRFKACCELPFRAFDAFQTV